MSTWLVAPDQPRPPISAADCSYTRCSRWGVHGNLSNMTYCVAMLLDTGLVFLSDSRTSAGVDQINTFRKTVVFQRPSDRVMVLQTAGNLAITQAVTSVLREHIEAGDGQPSLFSVANLFEAARCVGDAIREVHKRDAEQRKEVGLDFNASIILGGQIRS